MTVWFKCALILSLAGCGCLVAAQVPAAGQWVAVELGNGDAAVSMWAYPVYLMGLEDDLPFAPGVINGSGAVINDMGFEGTMGGGEEYDLVAMTVWHPMTAIAYLFTYQIGRVTPCGVLWYDPDRENVIFSGGIAINDDGWAVGWADDWVSGQWVMTPVLWDGDTFHQLMEMEVVSNYPVHGAASAISPSGVVGGFIRSEVKRNQGFRMMHPLSPTVEWFAQPAPDDNLQWVRVRGINDQGMAAGTFMYVDDTGQSSWRVPVVWGEDKLVAANFRDADLNVQGEALAINAAGNVAGYGLHRDAPHESGGFRFHPATRQLEWISSGVAGVSGTYPTSLNDFDQVAGFRVIETPDPDEPLNQAFFWDGGEPDTLGSMWHDHSWAYRIDNNGRIFGFVSESPIWVDRVVYWQKEHAGDGNGDGVADNTQAHVVSFDCATGVPVTLAADPGLQLSEIGAMMRLSESFFMEFPVLRYDTPTGFIQFRLDGLAPGAETDVQLLIGQDVPFGELLVYANNAPSLMEHGDLFQVTDAVAERVAGRWRLRIPVVDGGPADIDGEANGTVLFRGGAVGLAADKVRMLLAERDFVLLPLRHRDSEADLDGDGKVTVKDLVYAANKYGSWAFGKAHVPDYSWDPSGKRSAPPNVGK